MQKQIQVRGQTHVVKQFSHTGNWAPGSHSTNKKVEEETRGLKRKIGHLDPPLCLNPDCRTAGKRHYISHCPISTAETQSSLLKDYRKVKIARIDSAKKRDCKGGQVIQSVATVHSALFKAMFANGTIEKELMADQGADANFTSG